MKAKAEIVVRRKYRAVRLTAVLRIVYATSLWKRRWQPNLIALKSAVAVRREILYSLAWRCIMWADSFIPKISFPLGAREPTRALERLVGVNWTKSGSQSAAVIEYRLPGGLYVLEKLFLARINYKKFSIITSIASNW